ncbi:hypothetical protein ABZ860_29925 [Microbispora sp. NPDC046973]|uniref:hypothetical protein n=1 Tax=Microbispora sp. NPDC046973 TaxID=3155022 RepID=UPI0033F15E58
MSEQDPLREVSGRRAWPWLVLAMLAAAAPVGFPVATQSGDPGYQPVLSFLALFIGVVARRFFGLDIMIAWYLPLLVVVAAVFHRHLRRARWGVVALLGVMAIVNLVVAIDEFPRSVIVADISAGSQPDWVSPGNLLPALLTTAAYGVAAVALVLGSRSPGRRAGDGSTSRMPRSR